MTFSRLDLDGLGSPSALAARIYELAPDLTPDFDIADLCRQLDIVSITETPTSAYEAALVMDEHKASGAILLAEGRSAERRRFSIGHELGHFLIPTHMPRAGEPMTCALADFHHTDAKAHDRHKRIEAEANRFAAALLMPPQRIRRAMTSREPDLAEIVRLAREFAVSKEAMARGYVAASRADIAVLVVQHRRLLRVYRSAEFPWIEVQVGQSVPPDSLAVDGIHLPGTLTTIEECEPEIWLGSSATASVEVMTEQVLGQAKGYALILLRVESGET